MAKLDAISYTLATIAGVCLLGGLLVLTGGDPTSGDIGKIYISNR